ncbi:MAG: peptide chain release factor N(5)-glutamine methyltransferase, partial [Actinomycetia bacterium]|nr:peptide chain release factor N(5)-glutamine methyltransferase [Actinomycetes bacterium]
MKLNQALKWGETKASKGVFLPQKTEAKNILLKILNISYEELLKNSDRKIAPHILEQYKSLINLRDYGIPLSKLIGKKDFRNLCLVIYPGVFMPRPETELLVEIAIRQIEKENLKRVWDVGTGSGAIALSLANEKKDILIYGTDTSLKAIENARENGKHNILRSKTKFFLGDLDDVFYSRIKNKVDMIVSNPPYIPTWQLKVLPPEVKHYEPLMALDGGEDGLTFYKRIA